MQQMLHLHTSIWTLVPMLCRALLVLVSSSKAAAASFCHLHVSPRLCAAFVYERLSTTRANVSVHGTKLVPQQDRCWWLSIMLILTGCHDLLYCAACRHVCAQTCVRCALCTRASRLVRRKRTCCSQRHHAPGQPGELNLQCISVLMRQHLTMADSP